MGECRHLLNFSWGKCAPSRSQTGKSALSENFSLKSAWLHAPLRVWSTRGGKQQLLLPDSSLNQELHSLGKRWYTLLFPLASPCFPGHSWGGVLQSSGTRNHSWGSYPCPIPVQTPGFKCFLCCLAWHSGQGLQSLGTGNQAWGDWLQAYFPASAGFPLLSPTSQFVVARLSHRGTESQVKEPPSSPPCSLSGLESSFWGVGKEGCWYASLLPASLPVPQIGHWEPSRVSSTKPPPPAPQTGDSGEGIALLLSSSWKWEDWSSCSFPCFIQVRISKVWGSYTKQGRGDSCRLLYPETFLAVKIFQ